MVCSQCGILNPQEYMPVAEEVNVVWQIAQRDYKFGKGKHSSLTTTTYDAIGNKFRGLWGKEAGWAHSVLFTADLRAFSERHSPKFEVKEVKQEDKSAVLMEIQAKAEVLPSASVKRERLDDLTALNVIEEAGTRKVVKRKRKA